MPTQKNKAQDPQAIIVMGVAGSGKSTVGAALGRALGWPFFDGDKFHPQANVDKMAAGIPLTDADRVPWLQRLHQLIVEKAAKNQSLVLACSALKHSYRHALSGPAEMHFVFLKGDFETIFSRLSHRSGHYMPAELLHSQFDDLEEPREAVVVDVKKTVDEIVLEVLVTLAFSEEPKPSPSLPQS